MATAFKDLKPFPSNPRAQIGANNPPLEDSILLDFDEALRGHEGLIERIDEMELKAEGYKACIDEDAAGNAGDFIKAARVAAETVEAEREKLNRPLLNAQRSLMARSKNYQDRAKAAGLKVKALLDIYAADRDDRIRKEAARIAELARQAEAARQAIIDEANRKAAAEAEAERKRLQDIEDKRAAAEAREAAVVEVKPEPVIMAPATPAWAPSDFKAAPIRGNYGTTVSTVETWHVKVDNIRQVPDMFLKHPAVIEALEKVIGPSVRGKSGLREIKGCIITSTLGTTVR